MKARAPSRRSSHRSPIFANDREERQCRSRLCTVRIARGSRSSSGLPAIRDFEACSRLFEVKENNGEKGGARELTSREESRRIYRKDLRAGSRRKVSCTSPITIFTLSRRGRFRVRVDRVDRVDHRRLRWFHISLIARCLIGEVGNRVISMQGRWDDF